MTSRTEPVSQTSGQPAPIWVISDGRAGIEAPALGLAEALCLPEAMGVGFERRPIAWPNWLGRLEAVLPYWIFRWLMPPIGPMRPKLAIGAGRLAAPILRQLSALGVTSVFLGNPRVSPDRFDLVIAPAHDELSGPNVVLTAGSLHRITPARLNQARVEWASLLETLPDPKIAVLIGGKSKRHDLPEAEAEYLADQLLALAQGGAGLMITLSRRTPAPARAAITARLKGCQGVQLYDGDGANPYFGYLAHADVVLVTNDSVNMASEAVATGKPVMVIPLPGRDGKLARFHQHLAQKGLTRPFDGRIEQWTPPDHGPDDMAKATKAVRAIFEKLEG
jgi:mitochondrial fission protein ELM1